MTGSETSSTCAPGQTSNTGNSLTSALGNDAGSSSQSQAREGQGARRTIVRSRNGCLTCRKRRIKCDMGKPECARCIKYAAQCVYPRKQQLIPPRHILPASRSNSASSTSPRKPSNSDRIPKPPPIAAASTVSQAVPQSPPVKDSTSRKPDDLDPQSQWISQQTQSTVPDLSAALGSLPSLSHLPEPATSPTMSRGGRSARPLALQTALEALGPVDRLLAVCRNTRMGSFFLQPSAPPDFLRMFFPSTEDLQCFHHCVTYTLSIIVVSEERNPWMESVAPLFMSNEERPSGGEALKLSMLYLGAVHLSYLQGRDGDQSTSSKTRSLALRYRLECVRILRPLAHVRAAVCNPTFLSAAALTLTADLLASNMRWREIMRLVKRSVAIAGGLDLILFPSHGQGQPVNPAMKCAVEALVNISQLAVFSSGEEYSLLVGSRTANDEQNGWWARLAEAERSQPNLRAFEAGCGISRSLIFPLAQLLSTISESRSLCLSSSTSIMNTNTATIDRIDNEWTSWVLPSTLDLRTQAGSLAIWQAGKILIMRILRKLSRGDAKVQEAASAVLAICASVGDKVEYMNWPMIIACSNLIDPTSRDTARAQFKSFVTQCCYEIEVVQMLCEEMWIRMDEGEDDEACGWVEILIELGCPVLLG